MSLHAERLTAAVCYHGEGPFWDAVRNRMLCCDLLAGAVIAIGPDGATSRHKVPSPVVSTIRRRTAGGFLLATERGVIRADEEFLDFDTVTELFDDPACRTNDGGCDPAGGFVIGTMAYDARSGGGVVYRVSPAGEVAVLVPSVSISNGVQWSNDGTRVFYIDSLTRRIDTFAVDPDSGAWSGRRAHIELDGSTPGDPDGMAIDTEDGLWVALWDGHAVNHYDATGRLVETVRVPGASRVSSCAFGGDDLSVLFITTSRQGLADDAEPDAGAVFVVDTQYQGAVPWAFAG